jgi:hypothetical protein
MTRFSSDQLAKQYLQDFLEPLGLVQRNFEAPGEPKYIDIWFDPTPNPEKDVEDLGLLGRIATTPCLLEPTRTQVKLLWVQQEQWRKADRENRELVDTELAHLWILATRIDQPTLNKLAATPPPIGLTGFSYYQVMPKSP